MNRKVRLRVILGGAAISAVVLGAVVALGGSGPKHVDYAVAAFTPVNESTHNKAGSSVCGSFVDHGATFSPANENQGDLNNSKGGFLQSVSLPQGVKVGSLSLFANDADADFDAYVYLVRKLIEKGLSPQFNGYKVMATTHTKGAVTNTMRRFTDGSVSKARVNNDRFYYYLELVNCANTVEPFAVQIAYSP